MGTIFSRPACLRSASGATCAALLVGLGVVGAPSQARALETGDDTRYYEDDGLLDITEWFDGNDYNPTDEAWWRVDDESYDAKADTSGDSDSDSDWHGYNAGNDNDWYYDYYDPYPYYYSYDLSTPDLLSYSSHYYDYDNDGTYDAMLTSTDWDRDGVFEVSNYYSFSDAGTEQQKKQVKEQTKDKSANMARVMSVTGKIEKTKMVKVRGGKQHVVVAIKPDKPVEGQADATVIIDLGDAEKLKDVNPKLGDTIMAKGPRAKVGKQAVVLAKSVEMNGKTIEIDRNPREVTGKVLSTKQVTVRGTEHLMAIVETQQKGKTQKIAVDLGRADRMKTTPADGSSLTFSGSPVKVMVKGKAKPLMIAQSIKVDGKTVQIDRKPEKAMAGNAGAAKKK